MAQVGLLIPGLEETGQEDIQQVMARLCHPCFQCGLGLLRPQNQGLIYRGTPQGWLAVVSEMPGDHETKLNKALVGNAGDKWEDWAKYLEVSDQLDYLVINVVQCQPPRALVKGKPVGKQRSPGRDEIKTCFSNRCLRVLRAMPKLECVITLGWVAARELLGGEPGERSHLGNWYVTDLLPGVAVYCLYHPSHLLQSPSDEKDGRSLECLGQFKREYLQAIQLAKRGKEKS